MCLVKEFECHCAQTLLSVLLVALILFVSVLFERSLSLSRSVCTSSPVPLQTNEEA